MNQSTKRTFRFFKEPKQELIEFPSSDEIIDLTGDEDNEEEKAMEKAAPIGDRVLKEVNAKK